MYVILIISVYASFQFQFNIPIRPEAWARIKNSHRDSLFVKELAVAMWGTKTLGERILTGKECPTMHKDIQAAPNPRETHHTERYIIVCYLNTFPA